VVRHEACSIFEKRFSVYRTAAAAMCSGPLQTLHYSGYLLYGY